MAILVIGALRLWLSAARTVEGIGWSDYDDLWFIRRARAILEGRWLGDYDHLTLIKGQGYPLWIAITSWSGIPLLFAQQLLYILACLAVTKALGPLLRSRLATVGAFAVLAFNPMSFADEVATRVTREGFYPALGMLVFAGMAGLVLRREKLVIFSSIATGIAFAVFWHTREEGVWILPLVAWIALAMPWRRLLVAGAIVASIVLAAHSALVVANERHYEMPATVEFKERSFLRAYGSLTRVAPLPRIPVSKAARERVYAISPAFAELRPFLEGPVGSDWAKVSKIENPADIGWPFMWALREAVQNAGYYDRGGAAVRGYYERVAREIEVARQNGQLEALPGRATLRPPLLPGQIPEILRTWIRGLLRVFRFTDFAATPRFSLGDVPELHEYAMTHSPVAPRETTIVRTHLAGFAVHIEGSVDITVDPPEGAIVKRVPSPALYDHLLKTWKPFEPARHAGFDITIPGEGASLVLWFRGRVIERIPLGTNIPDSSHPKVRMNVESFDVDTTKSQLRPLDVWRLRVLNGIGRAYQLAFLPLVALAALLCAIRWRGEWRTLALLAALLSAIAARVMILALIDVTSFFVFTPGYEAPSHALALIATVLVVNESARSWWVRSGSPARSDAPGI